ncbi:hypothetical protein NL393_40315, partial [Klebsiella pneumoniae]|nr:hypothetical protein [Klebsiella pneumoniae]
ADAIVEDLRGVEIATQALVEQGQGLSKNFSAPLNEALDSIRNAKSQMEQGTQALAEEGQAVFSRISAVVTTLDFE